jgi:vesicle coat complex subunit
LAVGALGLLPDPAIPALQKLLQDKDEYVQITSAWALAHIDPRNSAKVCLKPLERGLKHSDARTRLAAAEALGLLGPGAREADASLAELREDEDPAVRKAVAEAIEKINNGKR